MGFLAQTEPYLTHNIDNWIIFNFFIHPEQWDYTQQSRGAAGIPLR